MKEEEDKIVSLLKEIGKKHNTYCAVTISSGHTKEGRGDYANSVSYTSYISTEGFGHVKHEDGKDCVERLQDYLDIDDVSVYSHKLIRSQITSLEKEAEVILVEISRLTALKAKTR